MTVVVSLIREQCITDITNWVTDCVEDTLVNLLDEGTS